LTYIHSYICTSSSLYKFSICCCFVNSLVSSVENNCFFKGLHYKLLEPILHKHNTQHTYLTNMRDTKINTECRINIMRNIIGKAIYTAEKLMFTNSNCGYIVYIILNFFMFFIYSYTFLQPVGMLKRCLLTSWYTYFPI